jgi:NADPH2:quinone reductase
MPKIVRFYEAGGPEVLRLEEQPLMEPGEGEVRLLVQALGLNRAEVMFRAGEYLEEPRFPSRIGYEAAGIVDAVGPGVAQVSPGQRVATIPSFSMGRYGVYGESAIVPAYAVAAYPQSLSPEQGAALWMQYLTAYGALVDIAKIDQDSAVLVTAASSSVGRAAIQIAGAEGATVIAVTRSPEKEQALHTGGANAVIVTAREDLVAKTRELTRGAGASVIFDPVGGPLLGALADAAAPGGIIFEYGLLSGEHTPFPVFPALAKGLTIRGYTLFEIAQDLTRLERGKRYVLGGLDAGWLKPVIDRVFHLDEIVEAHRYMEAGRQKGKIVVSVP